MPISPPPFGRRETFLGGDHNEDGALHVFQCLGDGCLQSLDLNTPYLLGVGQSVGLFNGVRQMMDTEVMVYLAVSMIFMGLLISSGPGAALFVTGMIVLIIAILKRIHG